MDIFSVVELFGGLSFFLYGMKAMSSGLERMAGGSLERRLKKLTSGAISSLVFGSVVTVAVQSSSAVTVMLVGLVNSGILAFSETVEIIMGSNVGTTLTTWLFALVGVKSENIFLKLLKPENFSLIFAFAGTLLISFSKNPKRRDAGGILAGFAVLIFGMKLMSESMAPLAGLPGFSGIMTAFKNPVPAVIAGALVTAVIQSSAASVGILQAIALTGGVSYAAAIPIVVGQNIGTCATSLISSIGVGKNAKKVAVLHVIFNVAGGVIFLGAYYALDAIFDFSFSSRSVGATQIAVIHSAFNIASAAILFPARSLLVKAADKLIKNGKSEDDEDVFPDERLISTPSVAVSEGFEATLSMADKAAKIMRLSLSSVSENDPEAGKKIEKLEKALDKYEDRLGTFLVKLSSKKLSVSDSKKISKMLHVIGDLERIGDHSVNIYEASEKMRESGAVITGGALEGVFDISSALDEICSLALTAYREDDRAAASKVEPLEQVIDIMCERESDRRVDRLTGGELSAEAGFTLSDILSDLERISDHFSNIAVAVIEVGEGSFNTHRYLGKIRQNDHGFRRAFSEFRRKYSV